jgi:LysM repeat protein
LKVSLVVAKHDVIEYISQIEEGQVIQNGDAAISVLIPQKGDGLWEVAKKLKTPPEKVQQCNQQLNYPLTGSERIVVYRQKI